MEQAGRFASLMRMVKMWHLAFLLVAGLVAVGTGIGRFEAKSSAQEKRMETIEHTTKDEVTDFKNEVLRHLDELSAQQHHIDERLDRGLDKQQDILRDLAADVAVLCSQTGKGCPKH